MAKPTQLTDVSINELSIVLRNKDGVEYAPRNPEAVVLGTKAGEVKPNFIEAIAAKVTDALKGYFASDDAAGLTSFQFPVSVNVPDDVDGDGDGADDYNEIARALTSVFYDLQQAYGIQDDDARSAAVVACLKKFHDGYMAMYAGKDDDEKAGARHSAADTASLNGIAQATAVIAGHLNDMQAHLQALGIDAQSTNQSTDDDEPTPDDDDADKAAKKDKKPYGDVEYADPKNGKYPIDTKEHAKAAWSYINQEKNASEYSADELKAVRDRIAAACKKFGVEIDDEKAGALSSDDTAKGGETESEMTEEQIKALVADAIAAKAAEFDAKLAEKNAELEAEKAKVAEAQAKADAEKAAADAAKAEADELARKAAEQPIGARIVTNTAPQESRLAAAVKAALANNPIPTVQGG